MDHYAGIDVSLECSSVCVVDANGKIAQLMRLGWFRPVHCKSITAQEIRAMLTARKLVQSKLLDLENSLRGILRGFGLKVGKTTRTGFAGRIEELVKGHPNLQTIGQALLRVRAVLLAEFNAFEKRVRAISGAVRNAVGIRYGVSRVA